MAKPLTERQLERAYCAMEKRRDAIVAAARSGKHGAQTRMALARAADAMAQVLAAIQSEGRDVGMPR